MPRDGYLSFPEVYASRFPLLYSGCGERVHLAAPGDATVFAHDHHKKGEQTLIYHQCAVVAAFVDFSRVPR